MTNSKDGVLPSQEIRKMIQREMIYIPGIDQDTLLTKLESQIQPSSLDLTLGTMVYGLNGCLTPRQMRENPLPESYYKYHFPLTVEGNVLDRGLLYLIPTQEQFQNIPAELYGYVNNKSSSGRINLQAKFNNGYRDELLSPQHTGKAYNRLAPNLCNVKVYIGNAINQIRFVCGNPTLDDLSLKLEQQRFLYTPDGTPIDLQKNPHYLNQGLVCHLNLQQELVGWKGKHDITETLDLSRTNHAADDFWEPLKVNKHGRILLKKGEFYILSTKERICVPPQFALEMIAYDLNAGEFRSHYAGFFDPGFGWSADGSLPGSPATLEIIPHEDMFVEDGSVICKFKVEKMRDIPDKIYGQGELKSNYQNQPAPKLAKFFK